MTQPGETDNFKVSDHINLLNSYLSEEQKIALRNELLNFAKQYNQKIYAKHIFNGII